MGLGEWWRRLSDHPSAQTFRPARFTRSPERVLQLLLGLVCHRPAWPNFGQRLLTACRTVSGEARTRVGAARTRPRRPSVPRTAPRSSPSLSHPQGCEHLAIRRVGISWARKANPSSPIWHHLRLGVDATNICVPRRTNSGRGHSGRVRTGAAVQSGSQSHPAVRRE